MRNNKENILEILKEYGINSIEELKAKPIQEINKIMEETRLTYFKVFIETEIPDIMDEVKADNIRLVRVRAGTKRANDTDYYNKKLTLTEINQNFNFGIAVGYNHLRGKSFACVDVDGLKINKLTKRQRQQLPEDQVAKLDNLTDDRKKEIENESKNYLLTCLLGALPSAIVTQTQSGGNHLYIWNQTHIEDSPISDGVEWGDIDKFHYVSQRLIFPESCPIEEIRGLPLFNSIEIFTRFESKYIVLAGSFVKENKTKETKSYKVLNLAESVGTFKEMGTVKDLNKNIKNHLIEYGFKWEEPTVKSQPSGKGHKKNKKQNDVLINPSGILKTLEADEIDNICQILLPFFKDNNTDGFGHESVFALGGYFSNTITKESNDKVFKKLWKIAKRKDDLKEVLRVSGDNYHRNGVKTGLRTTFDNMQMALGLSDKERDLLQYQLQEICVPHKNKANKTAQDLYILIRQAIAKNVEPTVKLLADYINKQGSFFIDYETGNKYKLEDDGFREIKVEDISIWINNKFGDNKIKLNKCEEVLKYITRPVKSNYNLIVFSNGTLNTKPEDKEAESPEFIDNQFIFKDDTGNYYLPKIKTNLKYTPEAETLFKETALYNEFKEILEPVRDGEEWDENESIYYKSVGVSAMAVNEADKLFIIVGVPNARKTTLLTPLKRFFSYSELKIQTIARNERFQLLPAIRKDINLDDDLTGLKITDIGFLNSFVSGAGGNIERKGENISANLTAETTPKIWGASNRLPAIMGDGFKRRLCLILAENPIDIDEAKKSYQSEILSGERDEELGLMISYSIQLYFKTRDKPFLTESQSEAMLREWNWKSYPAKMGAEFMFLDVEDYSEYIRDPKHQTDIDEIENIIDDNWEITIETSSGNSYSRNTYLTVKEVNQEFKKFYKWGVKTGKIFQEQSRPSTHSIKKAMENAGFNQTIKRESQRWTDEDGEIRTKNTTINVYEDCILNPKWQKIYKKYKEK